MKTKILIIALLLSCSLASKAQITLDHVYTTDTRMFTVKLSLSGLKYFADQYTAGTLTGFVLYNPDHTIFKTINIPQIAGKWTNNISFVSETLFDTDTLIEYMLYYNSSNLNTKDVAVINENGNTLLYLDSADFTSNTSYDPYRGFVNQPIFPNGNQSKLYLYVDGGAKVYNLPGQLPCLECNGGLITGMATNNPTVITPQAKPFPNPSTDHFNIKYILPTDAKNVFLEIYDMKGSLVKKSRLNNKSNQTVVSNDELTTGQFICRIIADGKMIVTDKVIVTK